MSGDPSIYQLPPITSASSNIAGWSPETVVAMPPVRVQLLREGAALTAGDRNKSYGEPLENLGLAGRLKQEFWANVTRNIGPAEHEAIDNVFQKLARLARGSSPHRDSYIDGATYFAIAGECAELENGRKT